MLFNEKLKKIRKESNLTQEQLAEKLNVSRQAITKWESGDGTPDIENLKQISILFNISIDELIKEEQNLVIESKEQFKKVEELEIDHTKHFDINICKIYELNIKSNDDEKVKIELVSDEKELSECFEIVFDDLYNKLDIDIKCKEKINDVKINMYLPEKYIEDIELNSKIKNLNIYDLSLNKFEYDGELKYLNVRNSKGVFVLNASRCDIEASFDKLDGKLEINSINSTARVEIPKNTKYKTILNGIKNKFIDAINTEESSNTIELNGVNSKLIIVDK